MDGITEAELSEAFVPVDLAHALNRLSSAVYVLELLLKAGKL